MQTAARTLKAHRNVHEAPATRQQEQLGILRRLPLRRKHIATKGGNLAGVFNFLCHWRIQEFCSGAGGSTNSVEDGGQRERGYGGGSPLVMGFWRQL